MLVDNPGDPDLLQQKMDMALDLRELISSRDSFLIQKAKTQWSLEVTERVNQTIVRQGACCTADHWSIPSKPVTAEEVKHCLFSIPKGKSLGRDGYEIKELLLRGEASLRILCQDLVRLYNRGMASPRCMFKLDLQKVYDIIEWNFVAQMLAALNFPLKFQGLVMECLTTPTYTLSLNGGHFGYFPGKRGDTQSIMLLLRVMTTFSAASGLKVNVAKSEVIFNEVTTGLKEDIIKVSGFQEGTLPFKCLGVPIQPGRLLRKDCRVLTDKIVRKIRGIGARKLSYAGRLVLINSVLNTLHNYWASIFLIPKCVIHQIEAICRNFLWENGTEYHRSPFVAWNDICYSKKEGGLGIKNAGVWNVASVGKLGPHLPVQWNKEVWDPWNVPKHAFIGWLIQRKALNTRVKLAKFGVSLSDRCLLCENAAESHEHLFNDCVYSSMVIAGLEQWLHLTHNGRANRSQNQIKICRMAKMAIWYNIWFSRNVCRLEQKVKRLDLLVKDIKAQVHQRFIQKIDRLLALKDRDRLSLLNIHLM
ncbi:uncharacterized protein LOC141594828 [Silene latifolia]|uniref:uncharacterized protein LOC141594828 n=1 Tax=Silene latifolia TaxID=37657 RepID=UPI003D76D681